jgi:hypothetical protein
MGEGRAMRYVITARVRELIEEFRLLAEDLQSNWLRGASEEARSEWEAFRSQWPTDFEVRRGLVGRSESELAWMLAKALRFRAILSGAAPPQQSAHLTARPSI